VDGKTGASTGDLISLERRRNPLRPHGIS